MNIEPYPGNVPLAGPEAPNCNQIDDLIKLLVTIRERFGNTAVKYRVQWGANALWAESAQRQEIARLREALTPSAETKAEYGGEFHFHIERLDDDGNSYSEEVGVPWTTIKDIMAAILKRADLAKQAGATEETKPS